MAYLKTMLDFGPKVGAKETVNVLNKNTVTPTTNFNTASFDNEQPIDKDAIKEQLKAVIKQDVKAGVLDKNTLRTNARNFIKQSVNEQIMSKATRKPNKSIGGFVKNFKEDTKEIVQGLGALLGMGFRAVMSPIDSIKKGYDVTKKLITSPGYREEVKATFIDPIIDEYKEYRHPLTKMYEDPLDVLLDLSVILTGGGMAVQKVGAKSATTIAKSARLGKAATTGTSTAAKAFQAAKKAEKVGKAIKSAGMPFRIDNLKAGTKAIIKKMPGGEQIVRNLELASKTRKMLANSQTEVVLHRARIAQEIDKVVGKLTKQEIAVLPNVAEGFARAPVGATDDFYKALGLVRSLAKDQERFGIKSGKLTKELIERRKFQPLAKWLEKEGKLEMSPVITKAQKKLDFRVKQNTSKKLIEEAKKELAIAKKNFGYESLTGNELRAKLDAIKRIVPDADPIYMRHFFDDEPAKFADFFLNTQPVRTHKPGFLKKSYGVEGYKGQGTKVTKADLTDILKRQSAENIKWQKNIELIENIKNSPMAKTLKRGEEVLPGYRVFAPDGLLRFYRGTMQLTDDLSKRASKFSGENVWEMFGDSVKSVFQTNKDFVGVTGAKLYQVPEAVASQLEKLTKITNPYLKLFWDKPLDAFRFAVLSLYPRWNTNNLIGNATFSILSGDVFNPKAFMIHSQAKANGMVPDELMGGLYRTERNTSGKLGTAIDVPLVKSSIAMHNALLDTRVVGQIVKGIEATVKTGVYKPIKAIGDLGFRANQYVDDLFKGVSYINKALKADRKNWFKRNFESMADSMKSLERVGAKAPLKEKLIEDVTNWYYFGMNLTDIERRVVRRVIPFYSWTRWSALYAYRITTEAPIRATILKNMGRDFYTFTGQNKLPDHMRGSIPIGNDEDGTVYYLKTQGGNIFSTVNDLLTEGVAGTAMQGSAPGFKAAMEQATGRETFLGKPFTKKGIEELYNGSMFKFDPETGKVVEVTGIVKPKLMESLLRNYIPQYLLLQGVLTNWNQRYTAEGLDTILVDLIRDPDERKAVVKDVITKQPIEKSSTLREIGKIFGINIQPVSPKQEGARRAAIQAATTALKNKTLPILNDNFKTLLKKRVMDEIAEGTSQEELQEKILVWIGSNLEELEKIK